MARVLLIGNGSDTIRRLDLLLTTAGHESVSVSTGPPARWGWNGHHPHLAFIDLDSLGQAGIDILRSLRDGDPPPACVVIASSGSFHPTVLAFRNGAADCLESPVLKANLLDVVDRLTRHTACVPHDLVRLADKAVVFLESKGDAHKAEIFGPAVGLSRGGFRNWCESAEMPCKPCLMFMRGIRAVYRHLKYPSEAAKSLLDIVDRRTRKAFLLAAGGTKNALPPSIAVYLERQQFLRGPQFVAFVEVVRERLLAARIIPIDACARRSVTPAIEPIVESAADRAATTRATGARSKKTRERANERELSSTVRAR